MIDVSIIVATYNHVNYIKRAIDSILMQDVNFNFEVIIGEDCSNDGTREYLESIKDELPTNYTILFREHNYGAMNNFNDLYSRISGKYFIVLEGDDYWTDSNKLQLQYDFMESNPDYIAVAHNCVVVNAEGVEVNINYPECKKTEYSFDYYLHGILPGQTTTKLVRNYFKYDVLVDRNLDTRNFPGDQKEAFLLSVNGKVKCIQKKMSAYRLVANSGARYVANYKYDNELNLYYWMNLYDYTIRNNLSNHIKSEIGARFFYFIIRNKGKLPDYLSTDAIKNRLNDMPYKHKIALYYFKRLVTAPFRKIKRSNSKRKKSKL